uniref:SKP1-like protein 21 isoform X2 n=1 Tax=Erigeron canadensis TaxID=72917 RepID=UPI001CB975A9|nr:SKP1-like protein 21 isoform X2 [Erigeron canadensis]
MAFFKHDSFIWLQTSDDSIQQAEEEVAMFCPMICREVLLTGMGFSKNYAIKLPKRVSTAALGLVLDYCRYHQVAGRSYKERKTFDDKFIRMDANSLCDLISAADSLLLRPLVDLTARAIARMLQGKTADQIRATFNMADDLTEEEKLEPLTIRTKDPRVRLLNTLYARKREELKLRKSKNVEIEEVRVDDRSIDDLLLFINSEDQDSKSVKSLKNKKKNRRRKYHHKDPFSNIEGENHYKEADSLSSSHNSEIEDVSSPSKTFTLLGSASPEFDFDDELDPALKEELDREVEDFARRLNSVWLERVQGLISFGQDRRIAPLSRNGKVAVLTWRT